MYLPVDPNSVDGMWDKLFQSFTSQKICIVVSGGLAGDELAEQTLSQKQAGEILANLKSREYVRIGSSRMNPVPAHFAVDIAGSAGRLMELISLSPDKERLRNDVLLVCQFSFFENKAMKKLAIPFVVQGLEDPELRFEVDDDAEITMAYRV